MTGVFVGYTILVMLLSSILIFASLKVSKLNLIIKKVENYSEITKNTFRKILDCSKFVFSFY